VTDSVRSGGTAAPGGPAVAELEELDRQVQALIDGVLAAEAEQAGRLDRVLPEHRESAANLVHYVWLRGRDIRTLQDRLADLGLSSLGRLESRVLPTLQALSATLRDLRLARAVAGADPRADVGSVLPTIRAGGRGAAGRPDMDSGPARLADHARGLLGPSPADRVSRIMVTLPSQAATDPGLVAEMFRAGMDMARINCAHDTPEDWAAMIGHLRSAEAAGEGPSSAAPGGAPAAERCLVAMDLAGPKLRTGPIAPGPEVLKVRPQRSATGEVLEPATVLLSAADGPHGQDHGDASSEDGVSGHGGTGDGGHAGTVRRIPVTGRRWLEARRVGETVRFRDARDADRTLTVTARSRDGLVCELTKTAYLMPGVALHAADGSFTEVGALPPKKQSLVLRRGERLTLTRSLEPAQPVPGGPHRIGCSLPQVFDDAAPGERIHVDDGKVGGVITEVSPDEIEVRIETAGPTGTRVKAGKGINLPDTHLRVPALTPDDLAALPFVVEHADIVSLSFVRTPEDVADLIARLDGSGRDDLGMVLKIETVEGFENLPQILLEAMRWPVLGVMIARGDLAVEAGFARLAEVQEEILWLCESAHVPVIWATQVLDSLARTGLPSRAEVTDAAMAERAEAVMLNKGPYVIEAITFLSGVLGRMQDHVSKKRTLLRQLRSWDLSADPAATTAEDGATPRPPRDRVAD
jgi:pyruvate kinase